MSAINDGGPAFPNPALANEAFSAPFDLTGMTLRDYFAAKAMQSLLLAALTNESTARSLATGLSQASEGGALPSRIAMVAFAQADEMLKARTE